MMRRLWAVVAATALLWPRVGGDSGEVQHRHIRRTASTTTTTPCKCIPLMNHILWAPSATDPGPDHELDCQILEPKEKYGFILKLEGIENLPPSVSLESGKTVLTIPHAQVTDASIVILNTAVASSTSIESFASSSNKDNVFQNANTRKLQSVDRRKVLVVRVETTTANKASTTSDETTLSDEIFGTGDDQVNLKSQYDACSFGKQIFEPAEVVNATGGVYTVNVRWSSSVDGADGFQNLITAELNRKLGGIPDAGSGQPLANGAFDHVMYCIPPRTRYRSRLSWSAYGYLGGWLTVYNDKNCNYPSIQIHEFGHNLGLIHSGSNRFNVYGDQSGYMGVSYLEDETPRMCFNAAKSWKLGWYAGPKTVEFSPLNEGVWNGNLSGIVDFQDTEAGTVLVKMKTGASSDYYMNYNRQQGFNSDTEMDANSVRIVQDNVPTSSEPPPYHNPISVIVKSWNVSGESFEIEKFGGSGVDVRITINDIKQSPESPWHADVTITRACSAASDCQQGSGTCTWTSCVSNWCECGRSLNTTTVTNNGSYGNMFDVVALNNDVDIHSLDIHVRSGSNVLVYVKQGSYKGGAETNSGAWTPVPLGPYAITSYVVGDLTSVPFANPIRIPAGSKFAFYVTMTGTGRLYYTNGNSEGAVYKSDANLQILEGVGKSENFGSTFRPRIWNGGINYTVTTTTGAPTAPMPFPTPVPTPNPTPQPTPSPTPNPTPFPTPAPTPNSANSPSATTGNFLETTLAAGNGQAGNIFQVEAKTDISIRRFDIHAESGTYNAEIYKRAGELGDLGNANGSWELIESQNGVVSAGEGAYTPLQSLSNPVSLSPGDGKISFYIKLNDSKIKYTNGDALGRVFAQDTNLIFYEGYGVAGTFKKTYSPRVWNGRINYVVASNFNTTLAAGNGQAGNMWEINAKSEISIIGFDIHAESGTYDVEVYKRAGELGDLGNANGSWELIQSQSGVVSAGKGVLTPLQSLSNPVSLSPGDGKISFYIKLNDTKIEYTNGKKNGFGSVFKEDTNLIFYEGYGVAGSFGTRYSPRVWNGNIRYVLVA